MKLKPEFVVHTSGDQQHMVDTSGRFSGLVTSNPTAAYIVDLLQEETTLDAIVQAMTERYDAPESIIRRDTQKVLEQLQSIGALDA